jgi:hypothetical protein
MSEQVLEYVERLAKLLTTPAFGEESRRRQLNEKFEILTQLRERNANLFGTPDQDKGTDHEDSK